jgi:iron(III) transport system substrate-binding protein
MSENIRKIALVILLVLISCSFWLLASATEPPALAKLSGAEKAQVAKLIEGAKKEGKLGGYSYMRPDTQAHLIPKFREWYGLSASNLDINIVSMRSDAIVTKVTIELQAQIYTADIVQNGSVDWFNDLVARGQLMAYNSPEYRHFSPVSMNPEIAPANPPYFISGAFVAQSVIAYNPKYIKGEILHWKDVLRPEYKGKISCSDVSNSATHAEGYIPLRKILSASFFKELAKQDPFVLVSSQDLTNKAVSGEYPIIAPHAATTAFRANLNGAGLKLVFPTEGWSAAGRQSVILTHAPHPNAAKLFLDFYHSEFVQKSLMEIEGFAIGRLGVKSNYSDYPIPIYNMKGAIPMDWRKVTAKDRDDAREEFRRLVIEKK